jgi:predicted ArsR family transcriptional regulator
MDRKDFFKKACLYGVCACAGMSLLSATNVFANSNNKTENNEEPDWRIGFMQERFAKLIDIVNENVDDKTRREIMEGLGRQCSKLGYEYIKEYVGDIDAFLEKFETDWAESVNYDKQKGIIKTVGKQNEYCPCPFVNNSKISKNFCDCSIGWNKESFEAVSGKKAEVERTSSILHGDKSCDFMIKLK